MSESDNKEQKKIYNLYALFGVSLILSLIPVVSAALLCLLFFTWLLIAAYRTRGKAEEHSLTHNHATYIIRSLWIGAFTSLVTMLAASIYLHFNVNHEPFMPCATNIAELGIAALETMSSAKIYALVEPCVEDFISYNKQQLMMAAVIGILPPLLYIAFRFTKGFMRAAKGYRLADPKSWF